MTKTATSMDIQAFLNLCAGKWFSQKTNYYAGAETSQSSKADLEIALILPEEQKITNICQNHRLDPNASLGGLFYSWDTSVDWGKPKEVGSSLMVFVPNEENSHLGTLVTANDSCQLGHYFLGHDQSLTLTVETTDRQIKLEERLWFASDNLRLRTAAIRDLANDVINTTFYSEIRKAAPQPVD